MPKARKVKYEMTIWLKADDGWPKLRSDVEFRCAKLSVVSTEGRCYVLASGPANSIQGGRSVRFNLSSTRYPPPPDWMVEVIQEAGYAFPIDKELTKS